MPEDVPGGVGATAIGVAAMRAAESERQDRLFEDPLARAFVSGAGWPGSRSRTSSPSAAPG